MRERGRCTPSAGIYDSYYAFSINTASGILGGSKHRPTISFIYAGYVMPVIQRVIDEFSLVRKASRSDRGGAVSGGEQDLPLR